MKVVLALLKGFCPVNDQNTIETAPYNRERERVIFQIVIFIKCSKFFSLWYKYTPRCYKAFFMLNSAEHTVYPAHKC